MPHTDAPLTAASVEEWLADEGLSWPEFAKYFSPPVTAPGARYIVYAHDPLRAQDVVRIWAAIAARADWHLGRLTAWRVQWQGVRSDD